MAIRMSISITQNSQNIANNTSNVTVNLICTWDYGSWDHTNPQGYLIIDGTKYYYNANLNPDNASTGTQTLFSKTVNVTHNSDGTKTLSCSGMYPNPTDGAARTASAQKVLTTIPRKSTLSASNGTLGTAQTLTVTEHTSAFTHTITYKCGSATGTICTKSTSNSISWTPPTSLAAQNKTGTSVSVTLTIETFNGNTSLGTNSKSITCTIPASIKPSVSIAVSDGAGLSGTYGGYIQGRSTIKVVVTANGNQGSSITSYKTTADGDTYTSSSFTTKFIRGTGTLTVSTTVTDSRGRTASTSKTITVLAYNPPSITAFSVYRSDSAGNASKAGAYLTVQFSATGSSLSAKNTMTYVVQYKELAASSYTSATLSGYANNFAVSGGKYTFAATTTKSYDVILTATDKFDNTKKNGSGGTISTFFSWWKKGMGWAFGKVAELSETLDIAWQTVFRKKTTYYNGANIAYNSGTRNGEIIRFLNGNADGTGIAIGDGGATIIGSGESAAVMQANAAGQDEKMWIGGDTDVNVYANMQNGWASRKTFTFSANGSAYAEGIKLANMNDLTWANLKNKPSSFVPSTHDHPCTWLWDGGAFMSGDQSLALPKIETTMEKGLILVWSGYSGGASQNYDWQCFVVLKSHIINHSGSGNAFLLTNSTGDYVTTKYLYISKDKITGSSYNNASNGTLQDSGIKTSPQRFVLRFVYAF